MDIVAVLPKPKPNGNPKPKPKPELNTEVMQKLYEFGGLIVYEVNYFDKVAFKTVLALRTFSQERALEEEKKLSADFTVAVSSYLVGFDGAFKK